MIPTPHKNDAQSIAHRAHGRELRRHRFGASSVSYEFQTYSADEREFLMAMDRYKRRNHCPFPTWLEVLNVLKTLGYRKPPRPHHPDTSAEQETGAYI